MSTEYRYPEWPITFLRETKEGAHVKIGIWLNHKHVGILTMGEEDVADFLRILSRNGEVAARSHYGGIERGAVVTIVDRNAKDDAIVVSEYGEILTIQEVKAYEGAGKGKALGFFSSEQE